MLGTSFSCCLHWNIIILLKVDTSVSVGEQLSRNNTQSSRHKYYTSGHSNTVKPLTKGHSERGQTSQQTIIITWHLSIPHTHAPFHTIITWHLSITHTHAPFHTIITWHLSITHTHLSTRSLRGICLLHTRTFPHDHYVAFVYHTHAPFHTIITWHLSITHTHLSTRSLRGICLSHTHTFPHDHYVAFVY